MPTLSWRHHTLIQALLSRGPLKEEEFRSIFSGVTGKSPVNHQQLFNDYLLKINMELSYAQFELRAFRNQYDGMVHYGVVNNASDEESKLGTKYNVPQIAFYKGIIEAIVQDATAQGSISNIDALNIRLENQVSTGAGSQSESSLAQVPPAFRNFSMTLKEKAIEEFVRDQWLCSTSDGRIGLGLRSFLDLRSWFHNNDVPACELCNEAGVKAELCQNGSCNVRIHQYCLKKKFSQKRVERVCPGCGTPWNYIVPKAELIKEEEEVSIVPPRNPPPPPGPRKRTRGTTQIPDSTITDEAAPPSQPSDARRTTRSSARLKNGS